jgi:GT2 family glycosyltransferase
LKTVVLAAPAADLRQIASLDRALRLHPARIERVPVAERWAAARALASEGTAEWLAFVDEDVVVLADAFGALKRAFADRPAIVGGRALVAAEQRFGEMFGPARWGPDPAELCAITAPEALRTVADALRGPIDVTARGLVFVAAQFVRGAGDDVDPVALALGLALRARRLGAVTLCEPRMSFSARPDPPEVLRRIPRLLREASNGWQPGEQHRDPPGPRERLIGREVRIAGNIRGYERRPYPPLSLLVVGNDVSPRTLNALRTTTGAAEAATCAPGDADGLRRRLVHTGDRYLLVADGGGALSRPEFVALVERLERGGRFALSLADAAAPASAALFHLGRLGSDLALRGDDVAAVIADAVAQLPRERLFAVAPDGPIVTPPLPAWERPRSLTFVMLATGRPGVSRQTFDALSQTIGTNRAIAVIPAGAATTRKILSAWRETTIVEDPVDPNLGSGLNRVLAELDTDLVFVLRDDVQVPLRTVARLQGAFERIAGLGAAGPRINAGDPPQGLSQVEYRDLANMEEFAERRASAYAREAAVVPYLFAPALMLSRRALAAIGGFEPTLGFTRYGVLDYTRRLQLANVPVACCEDAFAHLFPSDASESLLASSDSSPVFASLFERRWKERARFEPERDHVSLAAEELPPDGHSASDVTVVVPVADAGEWERIKAALGALVVSFTIEDPVEIAIGLDGSFDVQQAVRGVRELLADATVPLERTVNVRIEPVPDAVTWSNSPECAVRLVETTRGAFAAIRAVDGVTSLRAVLGGRA